MIATGGHLRDLLPPVIQGTGAIGLLVFRLVIGLGFLLHSFEKMKHPSRWMQAEGVPPSPPFVQLFSACVECASGLGYLFGFFTPLAALGMIATMIGALVKVHIPARHPLVAPPGKDSAETCMIYFGAAVLLLLAGPGKYSLDSLCMKLLT